MAAKGGVVGAPMVEAFIKLVVGVILAAVFLALGWLAFSAIAPDLVAAFEVTGGTTGLGILAGGVVVGVSVIVGATMLALRK